MLLLHLHMFLLPTLTLVILFSIFPLSHGACNQLDRDSLSLLNQTLISSSRWNWPASSDCCTWEGIACDDSGRVTDLWLPSRGLVGTLSPSLLNLTRLSNLSLSRNWLSGPLPDGFFNLTRLDFVDLSFNRFSGELTQLPATLRVLNLSSNRFHGPIVNSVFQEASNLESFDVSNNSFYGPIPSSPCEYSTSIQKLDFSDNDFNGSFPQGFGQCRNLVHLRAGFCNLSGAVPEDIFGLLTLEELYLPGNQLSGPIDQGIVNLTNLKTLALYGNQFTGSIPQDIGKLNKLETFQLHINQLTGTIPASLVNCTRITTLSLRVNFIQGQLSDFDFSSFRQLRSIDLGNNLFTGALPDSLMNCTTLTAIRLATNNLTGEILPSIVALQSLSFLSISNNSLTNITSAVNILTGCRNLSTLILSKNFYGEELRSEESFIEDVGFQNITILALGGCAFTGTIPMWVQKLRKLQVLDLSFNNFTGSIPGWFGSFPNLFYLDLSNNLLSGYFPMELIGLRRLSTQQSSDQVDSSYLELPVFVKPNNASNLQYSQLSNLPPAVYLGNNSISGTIPVEIGQLKFIITLDLSQNGFSGVIPDTISNLTNLEKLDLSGNRLTGEIPASLKNLHFLSDFSVAYNNLQGPIPTGGQFDTFTNASFEGNPMLCGLILQRPCTGKTESTGGSNGARKGGLQKKIIVVLILAICSGVFATTLLIYWVLSKRRILMNRGIKNNPDADVISFNSSGVFPTDDTSLVVLFPNNNKEAVDNLSVADILNATNNFNQSNIIGCGGFGLVYKATFPDGTTLAIKKLSGDMGLMEREFKAEVQALSTAQHKNLVTLQGYCVHDGFRLLIYSFMENGSLDYWLHEKPDGASQLNWQTRLKIAQGASRGVAYMHQICEPHIVHRDLKSSNILLNHNFEAHVADFGLARLILPYHTHVTTELVGTLGYIPPEYSQSWIATLRGDVYSFGVVMLELLTGKRPVELFKPKVSRELVAWVQQMRNEGKKDEVFDPLLRGKGFEEEMLRVLDVACLCVNQNPFKRPTIQEIVDWLKDIGSDRSEATT